MADLRRYARLEGHRLRLAADCEVHMRRHSALSGLRTRQEVLVFWGGWVLAYVASAPVGVALTWLGLLAAEPPPDPPPA